MACNCICPEIDCSPVFTCINDDLLRIASENEEYLTNFCEAATKCIDSQFEAVSNGQLNGLNFYPQSILKILSSLSGFSDSGDLFLSVNEGVYNWVNSSAFGQTYMDNGTGTTLTGDGTSGNPFEVNLNTTYVRSLISITLTPPASGFTITGSPVAGAGTVTFALNNDLLAVEGLSTTGVVRRTAANTWSAGGVLTISEGGTGLTALGTANQMIRVNAGATALEYFTPGFISSMPTWQQTLTAGSTLTGNNSVAAGGFNFYITNVGNFRIYGSGSYVNTRIIQTDGSNGFIAIGDTDTEGNGTSLEISDVLEQIKLNNLKNSTTQSRLIGQSSPDNILGYVTIGSGLSLSSGVLSSTGSGGTVTSVGLTVPSILSVTGSPITTTGTLAISLATQSANTLFAGPSTGIAATPTFRAMVTADIPNDTVTYAKIQNMNTNRLLGRSTAGTGDIEELTLGDGLILTAGVLSTFGRPLIGVTRFTSSGTWTKPAGCNAVVVKVVGAGGGGGGVSGSGSNAAVGAGGGSGAYSMNYIASGLGSSETVTIGTAGAGGLAGNNAGSDGGDTSFGAHVVAEGGVGGSGMAFGTTAAILAGGSCGAVTASSGVIIASGGNYGGNAIRLSGTVASPGFGGPGPDGGLIQTSAVSGVGLTGLGRGSGGSGALSLDGNDYAGGPGLGGLVVVYEFS